MLGSDSRLWVVKFQNNPQHLRVLANEFLATRLAAHLGLTVPRCEVIEVTAWLIDATPTMRFSGLSQQAQPYRAGLQFGSQFVGGLMPGQVLDYLPDPQLEQVRNLHEFAGMLCLDKWTGNCNGRQAVFERSPRQRLYRASFIDQGFCFSGGDWAFSDAPLRGVYQCNTVYRHVTGWSSFEPWLERLQSLNPDLLWRIAGEMPPEWYAHDEPALEQLLEQLLARRTRVRDLIAAFRDSSRNPFPLWNPGSTVVVPRQFDQMRTGDGLVM